MFDQMSNYWLTIGVLTSDRSARPETKSKDTSECLVAGSVERNGGRLNEVFEHEAIAGLHIFISREQSRFHNGRRSRLLMTIFRHPDLGYQARSARARAKTGETRCT